VSLRIGIDLGGTKIEGVVLDGSREAARLRIATPRDDYEGTLAAIAGLVLNLERLVNHEPRVPNLEPQTADPRSRIPDPGSPVQPRPTIGIGIPGTISAVSGLVKNANSTWLIGRPLQKDLERRLGREVRIANDANCLAMSEASDGAGAGADVVFAVIAGTGVGGGIAVNGRILTGANGIAGEWGHNPLPWVDENDVLPQCYCGKRGCIETFLSGPALTADHQRSTGVRLLPPEIVAQADAGDAAADDTLRRYEGRMARALASVINVVDPDVIVLGGGMSNIARLYAHVPRLWTKFVFAAQQRPGEPHEPHEPTEPVESIEPNEFRTKFVRARHGAASGVRGAAWLWPDGSNPA
jgi:fructokinase